MPLLILFLKLIKKSHKLEDKSKWVSHLIQPICQLVNMVKDFKIGMMLVIE